MKKYYLDNDTIIVNDAYSGMAFAYNRRTRQKFSINRDAFILLRTIHKRRGVSHKNITRLLRDDPSKLLEDWIDNAIISTTRNTTKHVVKQPKTSFIRLFLEVTNSCNLRCKHCYGSFGANKSCSQLNTKHVIRLIKRAAKMGFYQLDITGGEALLHCDLDQILQAGFEYGMIITIFSNLTALTDTQLESFNRYRVKRIVTSIESIVPSIHDDFRGRQGAFATTMQNLELVRKNGLETCVNIVLGKHNADTAVETAKYFYDNQYNIVIDFIANLGRATKDMILSPNESRRIYTNILKAINLEKKTGLPCGVGNRMIFVSSRGDFALCPLLADAQFVQGNLNRRYNLQKIAKNIQLSYGNICCSKDCKMKDFCNGGCRARAFLEKGSLIAPYELYCRLHGVK